MTKENFRNCQLTFSYENSSKNLTICALMLWVHSRLSCGSRIWFEYLLLWNVQESIEDSTVDSCVNALLHLGYHLQTQVALWFVSWKPTRTLHPTTRQRMEVRDTFVIFKFKKNINSFSLSYFISQPSLFLLYSLSSNLPCHTLYLPTFPFPSLIFIFQPSPFFLTLYRWTFPSFLFSQPSSSLLSFLDFLLSIHTPALGNCGLTFRKPSK